MSRRNEHRCNDLSPSFIIEADNADISHAVQGTKSFFNVRGGDKLSTRIDNP